MSPPDPSIFNKALHIRYWLRCLKTHLPTDYTSNDSQRTALAFFILSALDLLGVLHERTTVADRITYADWIYRCQHSEGGFRGFTGADTGMRDNGKRGTNCWDPANLAATYFSLAALTVLGDGMERVKRRECLRWIKGLQLQDGSFGEALGEGGGIEGGGDIRYCYLAAAVRWILRTGFEDDNSPVGDIDIEALVKFITSSESYEGGIAKAPLHEAHAGWTYCGLGTLALLGKLPPAGGKHETSSLAENPADLAILERIKYFLVKLQTSRMQDEQPILDKSHFPTTSSGYHAPSGQGSVSQAPSSYVPDASIKNPQLSPPLLPHSKGDLDELQHAGFSSRCNKVADTCYSFWIGGALSMIRSVHLIDFNANRRYLLEKTQHFIGGFGKYPDELPDLMHSYLGLAALAVMREPDLRSIDPSLCISVSAKERLSELAKQDDIGAA